VQRLAELRGGGDADLLEGARGGDLVELAFADEPAGMRRGTPPADPRIDLHASCTRELGALCGGVEAAVGPLQSDVQQHGPAAGIRSFEKQIATSARPGRDIPGVHQLPDSSS
jgi:hypothetical protein